MPGDLGRIDTKWAAMKPAADFMNATASRVNTLMGGIGGHGSLASMLGSAGGGVSANPDRSTICRMAKVSARTGVGNYTGMIYDGDLTGSSGSITIPGGMTPPSGVNVIVVNATEAASAGGSPLFPGQWVLGIWMGHGPDASGENRPIFVVGGGSGMFPVILTYGSSPGADGTATAAATWAYTIYSIGDPGLTTPLASNIQPTKPRDFGPRVRQAPSVADTSYSYGTAFYCVPPSSGPNPVLLWDAGETEPALCLSGGVAC